MPTTPYIAPLDFRTIFMDFFLGSAQLFMFAFILVISFVSARYNLSNKLYLIMITISGIMFAAFMGDALYVLLVVIIGFIIFKTIGRIPTLT